MVYRNDGRSTVMAGISDRRATFTDSGLRSGRSYTYYVVAFNSTAGLESAPSAQLVMRTSR
jgi:hypothetical protein